MSTTTGQTYTIAEASELASFMSELVSSRRLPVHSAQQILSVHGLWLDDLCTCGSHAGLVSLDQSSVVEGTVLASHVGTLLQRIVHHVQTSSNATGTELPSTGNQDSERTDG